MTKDTVRKAISIIFANEGNYGSVNRNDNGALSVGKLQWHGDRAKNLLLNIVKIMGDKAAKYCGSKLYNEIISSLVSWKNRTVNVLEAQQLKILLESEIGMIEQDKQAKKDVTAYLKHIESYGITDENTLIFMADIENQGGAGASKRIIKATQDKYGKNATLDNYMETALQDKVFKNYQQRRYKVYQKLTGKHYQKEKYITYIVQRGDTLSKISRLYSTTVKKLADDNNISNPNLIFVGQIIKIYK